MELMSKFIYILMIRHEAAKILKACSNVFQAFPQDLKRKIQTYTYFNGNDISRENIREELCGQQSLPSYPHHP